jgi:hypothetical protein
MVQELIPEVLAVLLALRLLALRLLALVLLELVLLALVLLAVAWEPRHPLQQQVFRAL